MTIDFIPGPNPLNFIYRDVYEYPKCINAYCVHHLLEDETEYCIPEKLQLEIRDYRATFRPMKLVRNRRHTKKTKVDPRYLMSD
jgi:hypothetical protein